MKSWLLERLSNGGIWLALKAGFFVVNILPRRLLFSLSDSIAALGFYIFHSFRKRSIRNLNLALGERLGRIEIEGIAQKSLKNFLRDFVEMGLAVGASNEEIRNEIFLQGQEYLEAALTKGKGVIVLSAHLGNFFLLGTRLAMEDYPVYVLVSLRLGKEPTQLLDDYRRKIGQKTIHARPRRKAFSKLVQVLRNNEIAVVIADEFRTGSGVYVPFFGRAVLARRGPATLAARTGAAVVPACLIRDKVGRLTLMIEPEIELANSGNIKTDVRENTLRITQWLERAVESYPDQWNWMNIRWQQDRYNRLIEKRNRSEGIA